MEIIINLLVFLFVLGLVIMIHEFGHFVMAKRANILCHEFSLGMGPVLWSKKKGETLYAIRAIPFGGYVMMAGEEVNDELIKPGEKIRIVTDDFGSVLKIVLDIEDERYEEYEVITVESIDLKGENDEPLYINEHIVKRNAFYVFKNRELQIAPSDRSFESKTKTERFLAIFAGPFMNFVLAFFLFIIIALLLGFPNDDNSFIGSTTDDLPASEYLLEGDEIISINGVLTNDWDDIKDVLDANVTDRLIEFEYRRDGSIDTVLITPVINFYSIGFHSALDVVNVLKVGEMTNGTNAEKAGMLEG
ncbi:MAG: site-2 protease family protein, partial [Candidatus Izemoplasma sp.]